MVGNYGSAFSVFRITETQRSRRSILSLMTTVSSCSSLVPPERVWLRWRLSKGGFRVPEWIGTLLFLAAIGLTATKINEDFGEKGELGYVMLLLLIAIYAAAVGVAYI